MSLLTTLEHVYAIAIGDIKKTAKFLDSSVLPALVRVHADASTIETITALVSPQAANIERVGDAILGLVIKALEDASAATSSGGLNLTLDKTVVDDIKAIVPVIKAQAAPLAASLAK